MSDANRGRTVGKAPAQCAHNVPPESPISAAAATVESASAESVPSLTASQGKEGAPMASTKQACQLDRFRTGNAQQQNKLSTVRTQALSQSLSNNVPHHHLI